MQTHQASSRPSGASVIRFVHKLTHDKFIRTEGAILSILCLLCLMYVVIVSIASYYFHLAIAGSVVQSVSEAIFTGTYNATGSAELLVTDLNNIRSEYLIIIVGSCVIITFIFGYIAARMVLLPTRNALTAQKEFIGKIAHELRTPLAILTANNEIALQEYKNDHNVIELTDSNLEEINRMRDIINNLLSLNTLTNTESVMFRPVDICEIFKKSSGHLLAKARLKNLTINLSLTPYSLVLGNKSGLMQIMNNLFNNAINYTEENGTISIVIDTPNEHTVRYSVTDTGIGIEPEKVKKIFMPFYRVDEKTADHKVGSGLGLSIVRELVDMHRSKITVDSEIGQGTTIIVDFPRYNPKSNSSPREF